MPRSGDWGAGPAAFEKGSLRFTLSALQGFDFQGSHSEDRGLSPSGVVIDVPVHHHSVSLDFTKVELGARYAVGDAWDLWLRLPFAVKDQSVGVEPPDAASADEIQAMLDNGSIHHRDETYTGLHDPMVLVAHRRTGMLRERDALEIALGVTVPAGKTEENPYALGAAGVEHLHIQFGTGTFDPLFEASYGFGVGQVGNVGGFLHTRWSVYENSKGFKSPFEMHAGVTAARRFGSDTEIRANYTYFRQGWAHWNDERDENSGLTSHYAGLGTEFPVADGVRLEFDVRLPFGQDVLAEQSDAFEQGVTLRAGIKWAAR